MLEETKTNEESNSINADNSKVNNIDETTNTFERSTESEKSNGSKNNSLEHNKSENEIQNDCLIEENDNKAEDSTVEAKTNDNPIEKPQDQNGENNQEPTSDNQNNENLLEENGDGDGDGEQQKKKDEINDIIESEIEKDNKVPEKDENENENEGEHNNNNNEKEDQDQKNKEIISTEKDVVVSGHNENENPEENNKKIENINNNEEGSNVIISVDNNENNENKKENDNIEQVNHNNEEEGGKDQKGQDNTNINIRKEQKEIELVDSSKINEQIIQNNQNNKNISNIGVISFEENKDGNDMEREKIVDKQVASSKDKNNLENDKNREESEYKIQISDDELPSRSNSFCNYSHKESSSSSDSDEDNVNNINTIFNKEDYDPKGILNLGLNCYMDSLLQCLFNIPDLRNYFIKELKSQKFDKKLTPICYYFAKVMKNLLYSTEKNIVPNKLKRHISKKNNLFKNNKAADATDLYRNLIDSFINEIQIKSKHQSFEMETQDTPGGDININKNVLYEEIKYEMEKNYIYNILNVYNIVTYECPHHKENNLTYSIESDSNITFYLEKIMKNRQNRKSPITIKECFEYVQKEKTNNNFFCNHCQNIVTGKSNEKYFILLIF